MSIVVIQASPLISNLKDCILRNFYPDACVDEKDLSGAIAAVLAYQDHLTTDDLDQQIVDELEELTEEFLGRVSGLLGRDISYETFDLLICPVSDILIIKFT